MPVNMWYHKHAIQTSDISNTRKLQFPKYLSTCHQKIIKGLKWTVQWSWINDQTDLEKIKYIFLSKHNASLHEMLMLREKSYSWYNLVHSSVYIHSTSQVVVVCAFIPEVGGGRQIFSKTAWFTEEVSGQPELNKEMVFKIKQNKLQAQGCQNRWLLCRCLVPSLINPRNQSQKPTRKERIDSSKLSPDLHMCTVLWTCPTTHIIHCKCGGWSFTAKSTNQFQFHFRSLHQAAHNHLSFQLQGNLLSLCQE